MITTAVPGLRTVGLNLQVPFQAQAAYFNVLCIFLENLIRRGITIQSYEVCLVQLPRCRRARDEFLRMMTDRLGTIGVKVMLGARAKFSKEIPFGSFRIPAVIHSCAERCVVKAIENALWN